jgi:folate-dependent phosphoribosylglycinamide formyltransferase PurN
MRIVVLCSSPYSETGCATAAKLAESGAVPVGALTLPPWDRATIVRKIGQWGWRDSVRFAQSKLLGSKQAVASGVRNPYLASMLSKKGEVIRSLRGAGELYGFPVVSCGNHNSAHAIAQMKQWQPDVAVFTGGSILRWEVLSIPRFGVLNAHLALLPEIRGMSSPEWSLLCNVRLGITVHFMDEGVDTGPILLKREFDTPANCTSLPDLRNRMIAQGIEWIVDVVGQLESACISAVEQNSSEDRQYFVMHDRLKVMAENRLQKLNLGCEKTGSNG